MRQGFGGTLWSSFNAVFAHVSGTLSLLTAVLTFLLVPSANVYVRIAVAAAVLLLMLAAVSISVLAHAAYRMYWASGSRLPKVLAGRDPFSGTQAALVCVLEPSELFAYDHMVSFYSVARREFEELVGIGVVTHIQSDRKVQITMILVEEGQEEFAERLRQNEGEAVRTTLVKPGVPRRYTGFQSQGGLG